MNHSKCYKDSSINDNKIEFVENKIFLWLNKFWQFSLFYGDYLASLHSQKKSSIQEVISNK